MDQLAMFFYYVSFYLYLVTHQAEKKGYRASADANLDGEWRRVKVYDESGVDAAVTGLIYND